jgi:hypothetical protein
MVEAIATTPVTVDTFIRAETDIYARRYVDEGGLGRFTHIREPAPIDKQDVIRMNRDTLYSMGIFDLDAGPVTITKPDAGARFMSMQVIDQDHYTFGVFYDPGSYAFSREQIGTRYLLVVIRTLADPQDADDIRIVHGLQDALTASQFSRGSFEIPAWDKASQDRVRDALLVLGTTMHDIDDVFGSKAQVDPIHHLVGTALGWGGNPASEAKYINVIPPEGDGETAYRLTIRDVPVDGFWSISVYNAKGYFEPNDRNAYSVNNLTATKEADGSVIVQFGGCDDTIANCLPIVPGWSCAVRMYRPRAEILDGRWRFPELQPIG